MTQVEMFSQQIDKARRALREARHLAREDHTEGACSRAYYAMFNAAHAALWAAERLQPGAIIKTHSGLASAFGQDLVKTGLLDVAHGRALGRVQKFRTIADYMADPPSRVDAEEAIRLADAFIAAVERRFADVPSARGA